LNLNLPYFAYAFQPITGIVFSAEVRRSRLLRVFIFPEGMTGWVNSGWQLHVFNNKLGTNYLPKVELSHRNRGLVIWI
jgi:hypothetical protein